MTRARTLALALVLGTIAGRASGDDNDLSLARYVTPQPLDSTGNLPRGAAKPDFNAQTKFRTLASELGIVMAPKLLAPADTIGFGGFQFSIDVAFTEIANTEPHWDAVHRVDPSNRLLNRPPQMMPTLGVFVRKGIWLPLPSFELGAGAVQMQDSNMWSLQGYAKFALQEGFHDWPIPSLAVRGEASRLMGSQEIDLTIAGLDVSVSKSFGIGGTVTLVPYAGWNFLWIVPRSEVLDATPYCDAFHPTTMGTDPMHPCVATDLNANFVFPEQSNITRQRIFFGAKLKFYVVALIGEYEYVPRGGSVDKNATDPTQAAQDRSIDQSAVAISAALDY
ncbi:MAG TPA: hypothetical protein VKN99_22890 [Polyangia bacterium]|nr:hypothetical protein [Polyangia bacterium]